MEKIEKEQIWGTLLKVQKIHLTYFAFRLKSRQ